MLDFKRVPIYELLRKISELFKDNIMEQLREDDKKFDMLYFTLKTHASVALAYRDVEEARRVLTSLKNICFDLFKLTHMMHVYNQLGYCYRITKNFNKAIKCFKKML